MSGTVKSDLVAEVEELLAKVPAWKFTAQDWGNEIRIGYFESGQRFTVAKLQTFEGPQVDKPLAEVFAAAPDLLRRMVEEVKTLRKRIKTMERDAREDARDAAAEARWQERQGEDYGSY